MALNRLDLERRGNLPFNETARGVLRNAQEEACAFNSSYIGTGHILLGLLRPSQLEGENQTSQFSPARQILLAKGSDLQRARDNLEFLFGKDRSERHIDDPDFSPRAKSILERATKEAQDAGRVTVTDMDILYALIHESNDSSMMSLLLRISEDDLLALADVIKPPKDLQKYGISTAPEARYYFFGVEKTWKEIALSGQDLYDGIRPLFDESPNSLGLEVYYTQFEGYEARPHLRDKVVHGQFQPQDTDMIVAVGDLSERTKISERFHTNGPLRVDITMFPAQGASLTPEGIYVQIAALDDSRTVGGTIEPDGKIGRFVPHPSDRDLTKASFEQDLAKTYSVFSLVRKLIAEKRLQPFQR